MTAMTADEEPAMHYMSFDAAWQLSKDRRQWLLDAAAESRLLRLRRQRPRPPVDDLPRPPSTGGLPPAA
jgi:hypothetical protein